MIQRTAEVVSPKHPDKLCDRVSDAILDLFLEKDPLVRCAVETCGGHGKLFITGEVTYYGPTIEESEIKSMFDNCVIDLQENVGVEKRKLKVERKTEKRNHEKTKMEKRHFPQCNEAPRIM